MSMKNRLAQKITTDVFVRGGRNQSCAIINAVFLTADRVTVSKRRTVHIPFQENHIKTHGDSI